METLTREQEEEFLTQMLFKTVDMNKILPRLELRKVDVGGLVEVMLTFVVNAVRKKNGCGDLTLLDTGATLESKSGLSFDTLSSFSPSATFDLLWFTYLSHESENQLVFSVNQIDVTHDELLTWRITKTAQVTFLQKAQKGQRPHFNLLEKAEKNGAPVTCIAEVVVERDKGLTVKKFP